MGVSIEDIKHCLLVMIDCELCEECNLYGTTGTDHCEKDCVDGALHIINKYQKIQEIHKKWFCDYTSAEAYTKISEVLNGNDD